MVANFDNRELTSKYFMISIPRTSLKFIKYVERELIDIYPVQEAKAIGGLILEGLFELSTTDIALDKEIGEETEKYDTLESIIERLKRREPIQYILGKADFYGRSLTVTPDVLIPRQETEELVDLIVKEYQQPGRLLRILDIGTGSGCIAITLSLELESATVSGCDVSRKALAIAERNSDDLKAGVQFFELDILNGRLPEMEYDVIVSNPPYVRESEKAILHDNVLKYEPAQALFVPDADPLLFYRVIAQQASRRLAIGGTLYFEINEALGKELCELMDTLQFSSVVLKDLNGKERVLKAKKRNDE